MSLYIAAYDIADDARRTAVAHVLAGYGRRIQRSVFELWLDPEDIPDLCLELGARLELDDAFLLYPIDDRPHRRRLQWQTPPDPWDPVILL
jgi:CRISPR-associated protein Cas2